MFVFTWFCVSPWLVTSFSLTLVIADFSVLGTFDVNGQAIPLAWLYAFAAALPSPSRDTAKLFGQDCVVLTLL